MTQPQTSGMPKSSCNAMAEPTTSARSHAAMAISQRIQRNQTVGVGVMVAAGLRQIASGGDAELDAQMLEQNRHEIGNHDDGQQRVAELRAAGKVGRPVAGIHVADGDEKAGAGKRQQLPPERGRCRDHDAAVNFRQRGLSRRFAPGGLWIWFNSGAG